MYDSNSKRKRPAIDALVTKINGLDDAQKELFAAKCGTSVGNLRQIAYGYGGCSISLGKRIVAACEGDVSIVDLIPELEEVAG